MALNCFWNMALDCFWKNVFGWGKTGACLAGLSKSILKSQRKTLQDPIAI
jgi:hypothetical protein